jgi:hypothetical protein
LHISSSVIEVVLLLLLLDCSSIFMGVYKCVR